MSKGYLIAPSILSADLSNLGQAVREVELAGADWIQIDVMDGHFVPNITFGPLMVEVCRRITHLPLDVHLMIEEPDKFIEQFAKAGADSLTVHVEANTNLLKTLQTIRGLGLKAGVALNPDTPVDAITEFLSLVDLVLVMTVRPGFAGQKFIEATLPKIRTVRSLIDELDLDVKVEVDGGISSETAASAAAHGADVFVAASAIFNHPEGIGPGIDALREAIVAGMA